MGINYRNVIVGSGKIAEQLYAFNSKTLMDIDYCLCSMKTNLKENLTVPFTCYGVVRRILLENKVDEIYYTMSITEKEKMNK